MAAETVELRTLARRVKDLTLKRALDILEHPEDYDKETYDQTYFTCLKNSVPRTQEITGEEGQPISIIFDPAFNGNDSSTSEATTDSTPSG